MSLVREVRDAELDSHKILVVRNEESNLLFTMKVTKDDVNNEQRWITLERMVSK